MMEAVSGADSLQVQFGLKVPIPEGEWEIRVKEEGESGWTLLTKVPNFSRAIEIYYRLSDDVVGQGYQYRVLSPAGVNMTPGYSDVRIISLHQPWASLMAICKRYETRTWKTKYRGPLFIHAAKKPVDSDGMRLLYRLQNLGVDLNLSNFAPCALPLGAIVAVTYLAECYQMTALPTVPRPGGEQIGLNVNSELTPRELAVGLWEDGRYAWKCEDTIAVPPIPCKGGQGLRIVRDRSLMEKVYRSIL
jgi:activating signal cointegrator 1